MEELQKHYQKADPKDHEMTCIHPYKSSNDLSNGTNPHSRLLQGNSLGWKVNGYPKCKRIKHVTHTIGAWIHVVSSHLMAVIRLGAVSLKFMITLPCCNRNEIVNRQERGVVSDTYLL